MTLLLQLPPLTAQMEITEPLAQVNAEAAKLPAKDQNFLAFRLMEDIAEEKSGRTVLPAHWICWTICRRTSRL